ncbi:MAG TPA: glycosyltransferase [Pirellulales bacterium]|nr:glycosyltransferase [Pirellulales bacterium]
MIFNVSVVLPVFNAQSYLVQLTTRWLDVLAELASRFEIKIVDDGSTDSTPEIANEFALGYPQVKVLRHALRMGSVAAMHTGLENAAARHVLFCEENFSGNIDDFGKLWPPSETAEVVVGTAQLSRRVVPMRRGRRSASLDHHGALFMLAPRAMARDWSLSTNHETLTDWAARSRYPVRYVHVRQGEPVRTQTHAPHSSPFTVSVRRKSHVDHNRSHQAHPAVERPKLLSAMKHLALGE